MLSNNRSRLHVTTDNLTLVSILLHLFLLLPLAYANCRSSSGTPMCCRGRQPACSSYTYKPEERSNRTISYFRNPYSYHGVAKTLAAPRTILKRCFCDEHCTRTMDCCPDYRKLCHKPATDCEVSDWGPWTTCDRQCGPGVSLRRRRVTQPATNGGQHCPVLEETKPCQGYRCQSRRVSRSGTLMARYRHHARAEVAHLLPMRDDVLRLTRRWDMRWDVRRKLYLGRLIKQNKTERPEPDPYCVVYEITHTNPACQKQALTWPSSNSAPSGNSYYNNRQMNQQPNTFTFTRPRIGTSSSSNGNNFGRYNHRQRRSVSFTRGRQSQSSAALSGWGPSLHQTSTWGSNAGQLSPGQKICVICYPGYMREDLGLRCSGDGVLYEETRWRALKTPDCHGRFRSISMPQRACTCGQGSPSFIFV